MPLAFNPTSTSAGMTGMAIVLAVLALTTLYALYAEIRYTRAKLRHAREMHAQEMASKEAQIGIMRSFLMKQIDIARKMEFIIQNPDRHVLLTDGDWRELEVLLDSADNLFVTRLRRQYPHLADRDIQLFMLLRLKMPARSIATLFGISDKSVKQKLFLYKSKVGLGSDGVSLREFAETF